MADQIKNENVGEVSSPATEEKVEAPKRKEPVFAAPQNKKASPNSEEEGNFDNENKPERKLPGFKNENGGASGDAPQRKEPVFKQKERKFPVFANEVRQDSDDDDLGEGEFAAYSIAMPFAMSRPGNLDNTDVETRDDDKKDKKEKAKKEKKNAAKAQDNLDVTDPDSLYAADELAYMSTSMPIVGTAGVDAYMDLSNALYSPDGVDGFLDLNNTLSKAYVPTYSEENAIMAKQLGYDVDISELEPMPESYSSAEKAGKSKKAEKVKKQSDSLDENDVLMSDYKAEKERKKDSAEKKALERAERRDEERALIESETSEKSKKEEKAEQSEKPKKANKTLGVDPGEEEAEELLAAYEAEKARLDAIKKNDIFAIEARKKFEEEFEAEWGDPGIIEAAELLAADKEERQRQKELRRAKHHKVNASAAVVETADKETKSAKNNKNSAPLTGADSEDKKIVLLVPENGDGEGSAIGIVAPADADIEAYTADDYQTVEVPYAVKDLSTDKYDAVKGSKADKKAERKALAAIYGEEKANEILAKKALKEKNTDSVEEIVYGDVEPYFAPEVEEAPKKAKKAKKEFSTEFYDNANDKKQNRAAVAAALVAFYNGNKPVRIKEAAPVSEPEEVIYPDVDYTEGYDPNWQKKAADAISAHKEAKRIEKEAARAESAGKRDSRSQTNYQTHEERVRREREEREALLLTYKEEIKREKAAKAAAKSEGTAAPVAAATVIYDNFTELFDKEAYEAGKAAEAAAVAQVKAEAVAVKDAKRADKAAKKEAKLLATYEKETAELLEAEARENEFDSIRKQYKAEAKERKAEEKAAAEAERIAKANAPKPVVIYDDFTELFDKEAYEADKAAEAAAVAQVKADAEAAKQAKRDEKAAKAEAKAESKYDAVTDKRIEKQEKKAELLVLGKDSIKENKDRKAEEKAEAKAEKLAKANAPKPEVIYDDFTELFDEEMYNAEKAAEAAAIAQVKADEKAAKEAKADEKATKKEAKLLASYESATAEELDALEREKEFDSIRKQYKAEAKERKAEEKAEAKAEKLAKANAPKPVVIYDDFTETFDKEAYDAEKAAEAKAIEDAKAEVKAAKEAKHDEKVAKAEAKAESKYDAVTDKRIEKQEKKAELLVLGKDSIKENKDRKATEKAEAKAERIAKANAPKPEVIYDDFTELFDKEAYEADKAAEAAAIAQVKADEKAAKEAKADEKAAKKEVKLLASYESATAEELDALEREKEFDSIRKQYKAEAKERKAEEKAAAEAERIAKANAPKPVVIYDDFTETFDKEAYDAEKAAEAKAIEDAKAEVKAAKEAKHDEKVAKEEAKAESKYDAVTDKRIEKQEKKAELLVLGKDSIKENKDRKAEEKAEAKAEKLAKANAPKPEVIYDDFTELFDKEAYEADKAEEAAAIAQVKADAEAAKQAKRDEKAAKKDEKIAAIYDKETAELLDATEREKEFDSFRKQYKAEAKERKAEEKAKAEAERIAKANAPKPEVLYPDPELLFSEVDEETKSLIETAPGDVLEGYRPKVVRVKDIVRASKEDKRLTLLIKKDKGTQKRVKRELEELELAEKYVDSGALEMADAKTVERDAKLAKQDEKEQRLIKAYDAEVARELEDEEKLYLAEDEKIRAAKNKKRLKRAKKSGKFMLEYGSTYDPEWDGEFNNYGLPEIHPYTEGVKLSTSRQRTAKKERLSYINKKNLTELAREQCATDLKMVEARVEYEYTALELEVAKFDQDFSGEFRSKKEKRWQKNSRDKLKGRKQKLAAAARYEKLDNDRYYSVVTTDYDRVELPAKADREELVAMREELMRLLDIRDEINTELFGHYSGTENGMKGSIKGRAKVTLKARKRAHGRYVRYHRVLNKRKVTRNERMRIFDKMDEVVERKGDVARIKYILRKEKPQGKVRREYLKELKNAKRDVRIIKKTIERSTIKALKRARKREIRMWTMILAYSALIAIGLFALAMVTMGPEILRATKLITPESFHKYIDMLLSNWPL